MCRDSADVRPHIRAKEDGYYSLKLPYNGSGGSGHPGLTAQTEYANTITSRCPSDQISFAIRLTR